MTREMIDKLFDYPKMFMVFDYCTAAAFLRGTSVAGDTCLEHLRAFMNVRIFEMSSMDEYLRLLYHLFGGERARSIVEGGATAEENRVAIAALREALDAYFTAVESGEIDGIVQEFDRVMSRSGAPNAL